MHGCSTIFLNALRGYQSTKSCVTSPRPFIQNAQRRMSF
jgi:hypothetical protein